LSRGGTRVTGSQGVRVIGDGYPDTQSPVTWGPLHHELSE
jgi:hypothetical protein